MEEKSAGEKWGVKNGREDMPIFHPSFFTCTSTGLRAMPALLFFGSGYAGLGLRLGWKQAYASAI